MCKNGQVEEGGREQKTKGESHLSSPLSFGIESVETPIAFQHFQPQNSHPLTLRLSRFDYHGKEVF